MTEPLPKRRKPQERRARMTTSQASASSQASRGTKSTRPASVPSRSTQAKTTRKKAGGWRAGARSRRTPARGASQSAGAEPQLAGSVHLSPATLGMYSEPFPVPPPRIVPGYELHLRCSPPHPDLPSDISRTEFFSVHKITIRFGGTIILIAPYFPYRRVFGA